MHHSRTHHLLRGWALASAALWGGTVAHLLAGGPVPGPLALLVCWALSGLACVGLSAACSGRATSRLLTALGTVASQAMLHGILSASGLGITVTATDGGASTASVSGHGAHAGMASMAGMSMPGMNGVHASSPAHASAASAAMLLMHLGTAVLTFLLCRRGEAAVRGLAEAMALAVGFWAWLWSGPVLAAPRRRAAARSFRSPLLLRDRIPVLALPVRGPPSALFS